MFDFVKTTENISGSGSATEIGKHVKNSGGKRVLIVTQKEKITSGNIVRLLKFLENHNIQVVIFENRSSIPTVENIHAGAKLFLKEHCDSIVALGDNGTINCSKAIGIVAKNGGTIYEYEGNEMASHMPPPLFAISSSTNMSVHGSLFKVFDDEIGDHIIINDRRSVPNVIISDSSFEIEDPFYLQYF